MAYKIINKKGERIGYSFEYPVQAQHYIDKILGGSTAVRIEKDE